MITGPKLDTRMNLCQLSCFLLNFYVLNAKLICIEKEKKHKPR